jgi:orotidine-5'-phosphate decarboxylase
MNDRIIVPLDVSSEESAIALVDKLPQVTFWKVGLELFVSSGSNILKILKEREKRIFLDLKFHDIPNTVAGACAAAARYGVDLITIHATAGKAALEAAQNAIELNKAPGSDPKLIAITVLTSLSARSLAFELKIPLELPEYALSMAMLAKESGLSGAVCSPHEVAQLREVCGKEFALVCPGVRPKWAVAGDQQRVMTPTEAMKAGATYLVIGRPITEADNSIEAFERICEEIEADRAP